MGAFTHEGRTGFLRPGYDVDDITGIIYCTHSMHTVLRDPDADDGNYVLVADVHAIPVAIETAVAFETDPDYAELRVREASRRMREMDKIARNSIHGGIIHGR